MRLGGARPAALGAGGRGSLHRAGRGAPGLRRVRAGRASAGRPLHRRGSCASVTHQYLISAARHGCLVASLYRQVGSRAVRRPHSPPPIETGRRRCGRRVRSTTRCRCVDRRGLRALPTAARTGTQRSRRGRERCPAPCGAATSPANSLRPPSGSSSAQEMTAVEVPPTSTRHLPWVRSGCSGRAGTGRAGRTRSGSSARCSRRRMAARPVAPETLVDVRHPRGRHRPRDVREARPPGCASGSTPTPSHVRCWSSRTAPRP